MKMKKKLIERGARVPGAPPGSANGFLCRWLDSQHLVRNRKNSNQKFLPAINFLLSEVNFYIVVTSVYFSDEETDEDEGEDEDNTDKRRRKKRKAIIGQHKRWINNIVYYSYGGGFSEY